MSMSPLGPVRWVSDGPAATTTERDRTMSAGVMRYLEVKRSRGERKPANVASVRGAWESWPQDELGRFEKLPCDRVGCDHLTWHPAAFRGGQIEVAFYPEGAP
jgi:hypothetical protein